MRRPRGTLSHQNGQSGETITIPAGSKFSYKAPVAAGDHTIEATCTDETRTCTQEGPDGVWVGVKGLMQIPASSVYQLIAPNTDTFHPRNHYLTPLATQRLTVLAALYHGTFPNDPVLHLNDASLERGGVFDYKASSGFAWMAPHQTHRLGTDIDIRANIAPGAIPPENFVAFQRIAKDIVGSRAKIHSPGTSNQHFHVSF